MLPSGPITERERVQTTLFWLEVACPWGLGTGHISHSVTACGWGSTPQHSWKTSAINYFINCTSKLNPLLCMASQGGVERDWLLAASCWLNCLMFEMHAVWAASELNAGKLRPSYFSGPSLGFCSFSSLFVICLKLTTYSLDLRPLTQIENPFSLRVQKPIYIFPWLSCLSFRKIMPYFFCPLSPCYLLLHIFIFFRSAGLESAQPASSIYVGL